LAKTRLPAAPLKGLYHRVQAFFVFCPSILLCFCVSLHLSITFLNFLAMKLKSEYINPSHRAALEDLERYLSDIAGEQVEAIEVESEEKIFKWDSEYTFKFFLSEQSKVIGLKIYKFGRKVTVIPEAILQFKASLHYLNLDLNQINDITLLEKLTNLTKLYLGGNQISDIYPIRNLTKLTMLALNDNKIFNISPLENLTKLRKLWLSNNKIYDISPLEKLTELYELYVNNNQIERLPEWVVNRAWLKDNVSLDNYYGSVALALSQINRGILDGNPLKYPSLEHVFMGKTAVKHWFEQQKKYGKEVFYNAKILVVGEPGAGKTTLMNKLFDENYPVPNDTQVSTLGIDVKFDLLLNHPHKDILVNTSIWDFGGQAVQYSLHHFFLSEDALYILVSDLRGEKTRFSYWFKFIDLLGGKNPRVLVVFNRRDDVTSAYLYDIAQFQRDYPNMQITAIEVNFKYNDAHWQALKQAISEQISLLSTVGQEGIKTWKEVQEHLRQLDKPYLSRDEFDRIAVSFGMDSEEDIDYMLDYFHLVGWVIYYEDDTSLSNYVFLDPNWITRAIYAPLSSDNLLLNQGRFDKQWIFEFWKKQGYSRQERNMLLPLMQKEKFDICYPIKGSSQYVVPFLLPDKMPEYEWDSSNNLQLQYKYDEFMPDGILSLFIVRSYEMVEERDGQQLVWKSGVILRKDKARAEVIMRTNQQEITVRVSGEGSRHLREEIFLTFDKIFKEKFPKQPEFLVPCVCSVCSKAEQPHFYKLNVLENLKNKRPTVICDISGEEVSISKLLEGFELPKDVEKIVEQYIHIGDKYINSKINKTEINGNDNKVLVDVQAQNINIGEIIPAIAGNELKDREFRELKETLELFRTETAINLEQLGKDFVELIFDVEAQITDDIKQTILNSAQQAKDEKSPFIKFGISLSILKVLETFGIIPPGLAEVLEGVNLSASSDAKLKLKQLFRI